MSLSVATAQAQTSTGAWLVPAQGAPLDTSAVSKLAGKTCWGFFDKGNNSETARGAVFIRFSLSPPIGEIWRKWGKAAQDTAHRDSPDGYDNMGKTSVPQLTPSAMEIAFRTPWSFDWFIRPISAGSYTLRAVGYPDTRRGAIGELHCA